MRTNQETAPQEKLCRYALLLTFHPFIPIMIVNASCGCVSSLHHLFICGINRRIRILMLKKTTAQSKKKHLSKIMLDRMLVTIIISFASLMAITIIFVMIYGTTKTGNLIYGYLDDLEDYTIYNMDKGMLDSTVRFTEDLELMNKDLPPFFTDPENDASTAEYLVRCVEYNPDLDEINIVDENGIIQISSDSAYEGYDMHSGDQSAEFLCLLDGESAYLQDMRKISYDDDTPMWYAGAALKSQPGFVQCGMNAETLTSYRRSFLNTWVTDGKVGRTGSYLLLDDQGNILSSYKDEHDGETLTLSVDLKQLAKSETMIKEKVFGVDSYIGASLFYGDIIMAIYPSNEAWESWNASMIALLLIYVAVFSILFFVLDRLILHHMVRGVHSINSSLKVITEGNLDEKANFRESIEFDHLSDGINFTVDRLKELIREAAERIDTELAFAAKIQLSFLPHKFPPFPDRNEFELFAAMVPAKEVGGDFYDYFFIDEDHLALVIADVSGKGIPAAMFMAMSMDKIRHSVMKYGTDVTTAIREVNLELLEENDAELFVTVWLAVITLSTGHVDYVNAGHEKLVLCKAGGEFQLHKDVHHGPVAAIDLMRFEAGTLELEPGDILYQYTDGITEANDPERNLFGIDRVINSLNEVKDASLDEIDAKVRAEIAAFAKDEPQFDDMTTLLFRYQGKP